MNVARPHCTPSGVSSSAGHIVVTIASTNADSSILRNWYPSGGRGAGPVPGADAAEAASAVPRVATRGAACCTWIGMIAVTRATPLRKFRLEFESWFISCSPSACIGGGLPAAVVPCLALGDPVRRVGHAVHAAPAFARRAIEALERTARQRQPAAMNGCLLGHIAPSLAHPVDVKRGGSPNIPIHGGDDLRRPRAQDPPSNIRIREEVDGAGGVHGGGIGPQQGPPQRLPRKRQQQVRGKLHPGPRAQRPDAPKTTTKLPKQGLRACEFGGFA